MTTLSRETVPTRRKLRHRATVNMLRMGHCAPSITQTLLDVTCTFGIVHILVSVMMSRTS